MGLGLSLKKSIETGGAKARGIPSEGQNSDLTGGRRLEQMTSLHPAAQGPTMGGLTDPIYFVIFKALLMKIFPMEMNKQSCGRSNRC